MGEYTVSSGETLSQIAQKLGVGLQDLVKLNNIKNPNSVAAGAVLLIPGTQKQVVTPVQQNVVGQPNYRKLYDEINKVQSKYNNYDLFVQTTYPMMKQVYNHLRKLGFSQNQTAGIMGNIMQESVFNPSLRGGLTLFRGAHLNNYNIVYPQDSWQNQLNYLSDWYNGKLRQDRTVNYNYLNGRYRDADHSTARSSAKQFYDYWEKPGSADTSLSKRQDWADIFYRWFNNPSAFKIGGKINYLNLFKNGK